MGLHRLVTTDEKYVNGREYLDRRLRENGGFQPIAAHENAIHGERIAL
jgi:hypothetical protein